MSTPKISLLVPIYNVERYLDKCLDSVYRQTFENFEVICINDGSTDNSRDIIQKYLNQDHRFLIVDKPNSGYGASMNKGLATANGEYITILESDDYLDENAFQDLLFTIQKYDVELVKANYYLYWGESSENNVFKNIEEWHTKRIVNPQIEQFAFNYSPSIWSAIYRKDFLERNQIGFLETPGASYQDASFSFKVWVSATKAVFLEDAFLHYRQDNEASSVNSKDKAFCVCDEYNEMKSYLSARPEKSYLEAQLINRMVAMYYWNYSRLGSLVKKDFYNRMVFDFLEVNKSDGFELPEILPHLAKIALEICANPDYYYARDTNPGRGFLASLSHYYRIGGMKLLAQAFRERFHV